MGHRPANSDKRDADQSSAQKILDRVETESSSFLLGGSSTRKRSVPEDDVELWGRRLGRGLAILAAIAVIIWLLYA